MKAVIFDFDGTLTHKTINTWKQIWIKLGHDTVSEDSIYKKQMSDYVNKVTTYQQWCDQTCKYYRMGAFSKSDFEELANNMVLIDGLEDFLKELKVNGYKLHIVSGNFVPVIKTALKQYVAYFDSINANDLVFDKNDVIEKIVGTNYDYEGKPRFIEEYCQKHNISPNNITFVGNGDNDKWAYLSGAKTILINPDTDSKNNNTIWHKQINNVTNINTLLPLILNNNE